MSATVRTPSQRLMIAAGAAVELHHAFRIQQHVRVLRRLPLQAEAAADAPACRGSAIALTDVTP